MYEITVRPGNELLIRLFAMSFGVKESVGYSSYLFNTFRIAYVNNGSADWLIGEKLYSISKGDIIVLNNIEVRRFIYNGKAYNVQMEIYEFPPSALSRFPECLRLFYDRSDGFSHVVKKTMPGWVDIYRAIHELKEEIISKEDSLKTEMISVQLIKLVAVFIRALGIGHTSGNSHGTAACAERIAEAAKYISNNFTEDITAEYLARRVNMSESYFSAMFKKYIGVTIIDYLNLCRVDYFVKLLGNKENNVIDLAFKSGFRSSSSFYRTFKKVTGMTPRTYLSYS